jgi:hypothetical protein
MHIKGWLFNQHNTATVLPALWQAVSLTDIGH